MHLHIVNAFNVSHYPIRICKDVLKSNNHTIDANVIFGFKMTYTEFHIALARGKVKISNQGLNIFEQIEEAAVVNARMCSVTFHAVSPLTK